MRKAYGYIWGTFVVIVSWWLLSVLVGSPALPTPWATVPVLMENLTRMAPEFAVSLERILLAMAIGTLLGAPIGLALGRSRILDVYLSPVMYILYPLPKIVLLPILLVLFGIGGQAKVVLISIAVLFQMVVTMRDAARSVPRESIEAMQSFGAGRLRILRDVVLPSTIPSLFTALRVSTATSVAMLFIAESMAGSSGLGYFIMHSWSILEYPRMFSGIVAMAFMGIILYELFDFAEHRLTAWRA